MMFATIERDRLTDAVAAIVRKAGKIPAGVTITPESRLVEDLMIDSLDLVNLVLQFQDHFDVVIMDDAVPNLCRIGDIVAYLAAFDQARRDLSCQGGSAGGRLRNDG